LIYSADRLTMSYVKKFPGESHNLALMSLASFSVSALALLVATIASIDSSKDSDLLQKQLTELKKITTILESKD
jgi:hypothetical protein